MLIVDQLIKEFPAFVKLEDALLHSKGSPLFAPFLSQTNSVHELLSQ